MILVENRKARFNYHILETFEAGLSLLGCEIKSIRAGEVSIDEGYVRPTMNKEELMLVNAHIKPYSMSGDKEYDPLRPRKLLLRKSEIRKLVSGIEREGLTIVPLDIHLKNGRAKLTIGLAKGKKVADKRDTIKEREAKREMARGMSRK